MGAARGIAGAHSPEVQGIFLCVEDWEAQWFIEMNNTGGPVDLWEVAGVELRELLVSPEGGHQYIGRPIPPAAVHLLRQDIPPEPWPSDRHASLSSTEQVRRRRSLGLS